MFNEDEKRVIIWCLNSEIESFERDIKNRGTSVSKENHLALLKSCKKKMEK